MKVAISVFLSNGAQLEVDFMTRSDHFVARVRWAQVFQVEDGNEIEATIQSSY